MFKLLFILEVFNLKEAVSSTGGCPVFRTGSAVYISILMANNGIMSLI